MRMKGTVASLRERLDEWEKVLVYAQQNLEILVEEPAKEACLEETLDDSRGIDGEAEKV